MTNGKHPQAQTIQSTVGYAVMRKYILIFVGLQLLLFAMAGHRWGQEFFVLPWTTWLANLCASLVTSFDSNAIAVGRVLRNPTSGFGVSIQPGCNGVEPYIVLIAAIMAFPSSWSHRLWGLSLGFLAVQGLNVVRVISLFYLGQWNQKAFDFAHAYLWQGLIMLDVLVFWLYWAKSGAKKADHPGQAENLVGVAR